MVTHNTFHKENQFLKGLKLLNVSSSNQNLAPLPVPPQDFSKLTRGIEFPKG